MRISLRVTSLLLVVLTLFTAVSCAERKDSTANADTTVISGDTEPVDTSELTDIERRALVADDLPEKDFGGQEFRIAIEADKKFEIQSEELTGAVESDSIYNRNIRIEQRFNCAITPIETTSPYDAVKKIVTAGDDAYEICGHLDYKAYTPITAGAYMNWYDIPNVNLEKPWYSQLSNDSATINGKIFCVTGDLAITTMMYTYGVFYNMRICEDYGYTPDKLYELVRGNKWVIDDFIEMCRQIYVDVNGNGKPDLEDTFGYGCYPCNPSDVWLTSFDQMLTGRDDEGYITVELMTEKTVDALQKIIDFTFNNQGHFKYATQWDEQVYFPQSRLAFAPLAFNNCFNTCREMAEPYGILPNPKWDENQEQYLTNAYDQFTVYGVPKTVPEDNYEFLGIIYEALNAESYKTVYPAYYDVALKGKYSEDADTAEMVDIIMAGRLFDFSFQFGESSFSRLPYWFRDLLAAQDANITKKYDTVRKSLNKGLEKLYTYYEDEA